MCIYPTTLKTQIDTISVTADGNSPVIITDFEHTPSNQHKVAFSVNLEAKTVQSPISLFGILAGFVATGFFLSRRGKQR